MLDFVVPSLDLTGYCCHWSPLSTGLRGVHSSARECPLSAALRTALRKSFLPSGASCWHESFLADGAAIELNVTPVNWTTLLLTAAAPARIGSVELCENVRSILLLRYPPKSLLALRTSYWRAGSHAAASAIAAKRFPVAWTTLYSTAASSVGAG